MDTIIILTILVCLFILAVVIIILILSRRRERTVYNPAEMMAVNTGPFEERLKSLINQWKLMEAVKLVRVTKGLGLKESKDYINKFMQENGGMFEPEEIEPLPSKVPLPSKELNGRVFELLVKNQKLNAVKLVKENLNFGLKEAKDYVEEIEKKLNL